MYKELQTKTGAEIFILDKEGPPPGYAADERLVGLSDPLFQVAGPRPSSRRVGAANGRKNDPQRPPTAAYSYQYLTRWPGSRLIF